MSAKSLADRLKEDTYALCRPDGRMVGSPGHGTAEVFVAGRMREIGLQPYRGADFALRYHEYGEDFANIAGVVPGKDSTLPPLLIGAHYDSVIDAPCADDNGAAVAICLALASRVREAGSLERDLVVAIFDGEEPPYYETPAMGSIRFAEDQMDERDVHFAMIYDLVGHDVSVPAPMLWPTSDIAVPYFKDLVFVTGSESHPELPELLEKIELPDQLKMIATLNRYVGDMSDHGVFRRRGVPYLFFSCGRWQHYHQRSDTPDRLNYRKMARIAELSLEVLRSLARADLSPFTEKPDTSAFEDMTFRRSAGPLYPLLCRWAGVKDLTERASLNKVVEKLLSTGL